MNITTPNMIRVLFTVAGAAFAIPSLFFTYHTVLLIYKNVSATAEEAAAHRTGGMLIGAIAFPLAAIMFGIISWFCFRKSRRGSADI